MNYISTADIARVNNAADEIKHRFNSTFHTKNNAISLRGFDDEFLYFYVLAPADANHPNFLGHAGATIEDKTTLSVVSCRYGGGNVCYLCKTPHNDHFDSKPLN